MASAFGPLSEDESLLWSGQPKQGLLLTRLDILLAPFGLFWAGFAILWEANVFRSNFPVVFALGGVPFVAIGIYAVAGRFVLDAWIRRHTHYALTNRRILIRRPWLSPVPTSLSLDRLSEIDLTEMADGRGTIRFGPRPSIWTNRGFWTWTASLDPAPQFFAIDNARAVFDQIRRLVRSGGLQP